MGGFQENGVLSLTEPVSVPVAPVEISGGLAGLRYRPADLFAPDHFQMYCRGVLSHSGTDMPRGSHQVGRMEPLGT